MNNQLMFASGNDATGTAWDFFKKLDEEFHFGCDVAAVRGNCKVHYQTHDEMLSIYFGPDHTEPERRDCLAIDWPTDAPNWLNPPYSEPEHACKHRVEKDGTIDFSRCKKKLCTKRGFHSTVYRPGCIDFVRKAAEQRERGVTTVLLLAARTDTEWWHRYVWDAECHLPRPGVTVRFLPGRLKFEGHKDSAPFPSVIVIMHGVV